MIPINVNAQPPAFPEPTEEQIEIAKKEGFELIYKSPRGCIWLKLPETEQIHFGPGPQPEKKDEN